MSSPLPTLGPQQHRARFRVSFLLPQYWPMWSAVGLLWLVTYAPTSWRRALAYRIGNYLYKRNHKRRKIVSLNLQWCFPDKTELERNQIAREYFRMAVLVSLDFGLLLFAGKRKLHKRIRVEGVEQLKTAYSAEQHVILLTCHSLGLEYGAQYLTQEYAMVGLVKNMRSSLLEWLLTHGRTRFKGRLILRDVGIRHIVRAIKQGFMFYYLPDEDLGETKKTAFLPFFGVQTATLTALGKLARLCDASIVPCITHYDYHRDQYVVKFRAALQDLPLQDELAVATRMNQILEDMIRQAPEQYMWSFRMFQTRPLGEPNPYEMVKSR